MPLFSELTCFCLEGFLKMRLILLGILAICMASACTKKPTAEECQQAVTHISDILQKEASEKMKQELARSGAPTSVDAGKGMAEAMKNMQGTEVWAHVRSAHLEECSRQPQARASCISNATSVDELIKTCGMKSTGDPRGNGVKLEWPE